MFDSYLAYAILNINLPVKFILQSALMRYRDAVSKNIQDYL
jgi:hypothetical protein